MNKTVRVRKVRHYRPHAEFYHAAWVHLQHVKEKRDGHYYSLLSAFVMSAFTLEAYLNYLGPKVERAWSDFDRAPVFVKLRHVACIVGLKLDEKKRPFGSVIELFRLRNIVAHPRAESVIEEYSCTPETYQKRFRDEPQPNWKKLLTEKNGQRYHEDVGKLIEQLNAKLEEPEPFPLTSLGWSGSAHSDST